MSVTFGVEFLPDAAPVHGFYCHDLNSAVGPFDSPARLASAVAAHERDCETCRMYGVSRYPLPEEKFDVNVSNVNAGMILGILGLPTLDSDTCDLVGHMDAEEFLGYVMLALAVDRDHAEVSDTADTSGYTTIVQCGLPEGYVNTVLGHLADLALEAKRLGRDVTWA